MSSNLSSHSTSKGPVFNPLSPENEGKLDPAFVKYYNEVVDTKQAVHQVPLEEVRAHPQEWGPPWTVPVPDSDRIRPDTIPSKDGYQIPVRMYHPDPSNFGPGPYCVHLNFHGGGFVYGGLVQDGKFCVTVQEQSGLLVIDINYRHCPEVPYGKNIEDAWAALNWVRSHASELNINPYSISIGGISVGGLICAFLQHMCRDAKIRLRLAVLAIPVTTDFSNISDPKDAPFDSYREFQDGALLNWERLSYFGANLFPKGRDAVRASLPRLWLAPLEAENFKDLCDTFVITAECDPMRDEGEAYVMKVVEAGLKVMFKRYLGVPHNFQHMISQLEQAGQYYRDIVEALSVAHERKTHNDDAFWRLNGL